ncbi:MAG: VOC family protein [Ardenticatenales bacterium]|nr:VOC family protein [Ardenticatenales bacterium]
MDDADGAVASPDACADAGAMITGLDHVQLAIPAGGEDAARAFYGGLLGMREVAKPAALAGRGGVWFALDDGRQVHLGVEAGFVAAAKAHPAFVANDIDAVADALRAAGYGVAWDDGLAPRRRLYVGDPFGNRVEVVSAAYEESSSPAD